MNLFNNLFFLISYYTVLFFCLGVSIDMKNLPITKHTSEKYS